MKRSPWLRLPPLRSMEWILTRGRRCLGPNGTGRHGPGVVCDRMGTGTDGRGFPHSQDCQGRLPLRHCEGCDRLLSKEGTPKYPKVLWRTQLAPLCARCNDRYLEDRKAGKVVWK